MIEQVNLPVYALGGVGLNDLEMAWKQGAQGIAGISDWWS
jgi:8-oxo-dGTP diphosphatase